MNAPTQIHTFQVNGLGQAPYTLESVEMRESNPNGPRVGTSCDYCSTYITNVFHCKSADGKRFVIGSTCVDKLGDAGLTKAVNDKVRDHKRTLRWAKEAEKRAELRELFEQVKPGLQSRPHPNEYLASKGKTMLDYVEYCGVYSSTGQRIITAYGK